MDKKQGITGEQLDMMASTMDEERLMTARDEAARELGVRERCFPRWVKEGRITATDARDRLERQRDIVTILTTIQSAAGWVAADSVPAGVPSTGD